MAGVAPIRLARGDVFLSNATLPSVLTFGPASAVGGLARNVLPLDGREDLLLLGCQVEVAPDCGDLLVDALPSFVHIRPGVVQPEAQRWLMDQLLHERRGGLLGADAVIPEFADAIFVQVLRAHIEASEHVGAGWLRAIATGA